MAPSATMDLAGRLSQGAWIRCILFALVQLAACTAMPLKEFKESPGDPYLWLEEVESKASLAWVGQQNAHSVKELEGEPVFRPIFERLLEIYNSRERIPYVTKLGNYYYNFWRDEQNVRGVWRRATPAEYRKHDAKWEIVLDVDALSAVEGENWVWQGANCLPPDDRYCLVSLSRGGADAVVVREFDTLTQFFVPNGFELEQAKSDVTWRNIDSILVATDFGPNTLTQSGYPRIVKEWQRGTPLSSAKTIFEASQHDVSVSSHVVNETRISPSQREFIAREVAFFNKETFLRDGDALIKLTLPIDAQANVSHERLFVELRSAWEVGGRSYPAGALLCTEFSRFLRGDADFEMLFEPTPTKSLAGFIDTRDYLIVNVLDRVRSRLYEYSYIAPNWTRRQISTPSFETVGVTAVNRLESNDYFLSLTDFLTPSSLYLAHAGSDLRELLKQLPQYFNAAKFDVRQFEASSKDGTMIPYFIVMAKGTVQDGRNPTLLYGYGGFEISLLPSYSGGIGSGWLERGGVYVLANIRGGGEFGPGWHQAAVGENRQRAYDDFIAVAEDLIARKVTSPEHLGIMGGSNGGLLVAAVMIQRPDLFRAVVCQAPLLDMRRYHKLLAGASWMAEFGDPDDPKQWAYIRLYSPYQNVAKDVKYPRVLFMTSTRDDRVHPGHARKMAAKMLDLGYPVLYFENTEGGHAGAANNRQSAYMSALAYTFLATELR